MSGIFPHRHPPLGALAILLLACHTATAELTVDQAKELSQATGRPILAVAGSAT